MAVKSNILALSSATSITYTLIVLLIIKEEISKPNRINSLQKE